ncbi:hypothetical protein V1512DRAFT_258280 [Lipomyces arxii]|uniref:uncharacterized protein n=1 Tax=Lipomyces arxii TaxID=56418 RepID=UPI0034CEB4B1
MLYPTPPPDGHKLANCRSLLSDDTIHDAAAEMAFMFWFSPPPGVFRQLCASEGGRPVLPAMPCPTREFRTFVSGVLSRTQVSSTLVSLALLYIYRLRLAHPASAVPGSEYRVFTVALVLANKFLDDNTYTNKTWAQVSNLPVVEIGLMELEFLGHINYKLTVCPSAWTMWQNSLASFIRTRPVCSFTPISPPSPISPIMSSLPLPLPPLTRLKRKAESELRKPLPVLQPVLLEKPVGPGPRLLAAPTSHSRPVRQTRHTLPALIALPPIRTTLRYTS